MDGEPCADLQYYGAAAEPWVEGARFAADGSLAPGSFLPTAAGHAAIAAYLGGVVVDDGTSPEGYVAATRHTLE